MKPNHILRVASLLMVLPLFVLGCGLLPAQYADSYPAALQLKLALLDTPSDRPRVVLVGGSAAAFGVDSALMEEALPDYAVVHFGLYAGLGMPLMLELMQTALRPGDVVLVMPEQQEQSLSDYFNAEMTLQALDGELPRLLRLDARHAFQLAAAFPGFAMSKLRYVLTHSTPKPDPVYCRASFDVRGDLRNDAIEANMMPGGWDRNMPIALTQQALPDEAFLACMTRLTNEAKKAGAQVLYAFCPMNAAALTMDSDSDAYYDALAELLPCPILGDPNDSVMDAGWFYDTNFHLNSSGRAVYTCRLIRALKAEWGDSTPTAFALPAKPDMAMLTAQNGDQRDTDSFIWEVRGDQAVLTGLTQQGRDRGTLLVPTEVEGYPVSALANGLFAGCTELGSIQLQWLQPGSCTVGSGLLDDAPEKLRILVPAGCAGAYQLNYFWSVYAAQIEEKE